MYYKILVTIITMLIITACKSEYKHTADDKLKPIYEFGYNLNDFYVVKDTIRSGDTFGSILDRNHVPVNEVFNIIEAVKDSFDFKKVKLGKPYTILTTRDSTEKAKVFVYQSSIQEYTVIDFKDSIPFSKTVTKEIVPKRSVATGVITSSLFESLEGQNLNPVLAINLSEVYAWSIDFYRLQKHDRFKVIYDELYVDDTISVGIGKIHAAYFEHWKKPYYAFGYELDSIYGNWQFYDETAKEMKKMFLKSPIKFARISSRYSMSRYVSIYGRRKPHLGTDFAAPVGTPIRSTANGVVVASAYRGGNGNYVKIKHNKTYTTQYLHMSKRAVKKGDYVQQGDIIGYVGMTGNTTGPHVCYRFWMNGKQVDALKHTPKDSEPMPEVLKPHYLEYIVPIKKELDSLSFPEIREVFPEEEDSASCC
jgi:murein DD-endopeptidase MepM/ murein hydrolase activator NlpD